MPKINNKINNIFIQIYRNILNLKIFSYFYDYTDY